MKGWVRASVAAVMGLLGAGAVASGSPPLPQIVGLPLLAAALFWAVVPLPAPLSKLVERLAARPVTSWGLPVLACVALVCVVYHPMLFGHMPWAAGQADHPTHQYQAWLLVEQMLPSGRLTGWSDMRWAGYPALELYPIGGVLWVALWRGITFGALDWEATYSLALLAMVSLNIVATYTATRRLAGPWAAVVAVLLVLFERGWPRQGGDHYAIDVGVWPVTMGVGPLLLCFERLWSWMAHKATARALAAAAFFAGWAMLSHPLYLAVLVLALPVILAVGLAQRARSDRATLGVVLTFVVGLALVCFWYVPFLAGRSLTESGGAPFRSLNNLGEGIAMASFLPRFWPLATVAGLAGFLLSITRRGGMAIIAVVTAVLVIAASSTPLELSQSLAQLSQSVQQERFLIPVRVLLCILAGHAVAQLCAGAFRRLGDTTWDLRRKLAGLGLVLLCMPLLAAAGEGLVKHLVVPVAELDHGPGLEHRRDLLNMCRWLRGQGGDEQPAPRTAWYVGHGRHEYNNAPIHCGLAQIIDTPAETFATRPGGISEREVRAFGVRWVIGDRPIVGRDSYLELVRRFGALHVYEVTDYRATRATVLGQAEATLEVFEDELIRYRISNAAEGDRLVLHVARHGNWQATLDGRPVRIGGGHMGLPRADLIHVPISDGRLELSYRRGWPYMLGGLLTLLGAFGLALMGGALRGTGRLLTERLSVVRSATHAVARLPKAARAVVVAGVGVVVVFALIAGVGSSGNGRDEREPWPAGDALADHITQARVWIVANGERRALDRRWDGRFGKAFPPQVTVDRHVEAIDLGDPRRVVALRLGEDEVCHVRFDGVRARGVRGWFARGGRGRSETRIAVWVGRRRIGLFRSENLGRWQEFEAAADGPGEPVEIVVRGEGAGRAVLLDAALVH